MGLLPLKLRFHYWSRWCKRSNAVIKMGSLNSDNRLLSGFCQVLCNSLGYVLPTHHKEFMAFGNILGQLLGKWPLILSFPDRPFLCPIFYNVKCKECVALSSKYCAVNIFHII